MQYKVTSNATFVNFDGNKTFHILGGVPRIDYPEFSGERITMTGVYRGPAPNSVANADGSYVRQFGVKVRNANTCNIGYIMRVVEPISRIAISLKSNPGMTTNAECRDGGYTQYASILIPQIHVNQEFKIQARYADETNTLMVYYDGKPIWIGTLPASWTGIGGIRTDNVLVDYEVH